MADEFDDLETEAEAFLGQNPDHSAAALIKNLRKWGKQAEKRGREAAQAEYARQQARDKAFAKIPEAVRPLFEGIDPTDEKAITAKLDALKALGLKVGADSPEVQQQAPNPQQQQVAQQVGVQVDPNLAAVTAMQAAAAGGGTPGLAGDLFTRMQDAQSNPDRYTDEQRDALVNEYNAAVVNASRQGTSGALG